MKLPPVGTYELIIITAIVVYLAREFVKKILKILFKPILLLKEALYKWIAPRNPFSISIRCYKNHVRRSNLARIENPVGPSLVVPLEHAYAPLKLISRQTHENIELFEHAAQTSRSIVLGGPGTGKTTLMKSLFINIVNKKCHEELNKLIPVFIVLRKLAAKQQSVEDAIIDAFKDHHFPGAKKFINSALDQGRMLIILDGLDEVSLNREFVNSQIREFCQHDEQREHQNRVFVTCRENSYRNEDLRDVIPNVVRVEAFANQHMRIFLQGWPVHKGRTAIKLYGLIQQDPQIRDICRNPLLLTILTGLYLDDDNFELPKSRDTFYKSCIDELLTKRPARRDIKQEYHPEDKKKILERVCLERLEKSGIHDDPEELSREAIIRHAQQILQKDFDEHKLTKDFTDINGIIKPSSEDTFTCAHRTIQEYFAAREACRTREIDHVMKHFGNRADLIEVMYFYCGLINNIPQLNRIAETFISDNKWIEAGRCVLNMTEIIDEKLIEIIARNLLDLVQANSKFEIPLAILSSLAQKTDKVFESARSYLSDAIDFLSEGATESGASALESILSSSPETTMKLIPGLLQHSSPRWKKSAVKLLSDLGTDEALDELVQLLESEDKIIKQETAKTLADLISTRTNDLIARKDFLPKCIDPEIWPFEKYFPGNLAIPIVESLTGYEGSSNKAINYAVQAIEAKKTKNYVSQQFLKKWTKLAKHLNIIQYKKTVGMAMTLIGMLLFIMFSLLLMIGAIWKSVSPKNEAIIDVISLKSYEIPIDLMGDVNKEAQIIISEIEEKFPPNASGIARILPWNWEVEPIIPENEIEIYEKLSNLSNKDSIYPYKFIRTLNNYHSISTTLISKEKIQKLNKTVHLFKSSISNIPNLEENTNILVFIKFKWWMLIGFTIGFWVFLILANFKKLEKGKILNLTKIDKFFFYFGTFMPPFLTIWAILLAFTSKSIFEAAVTGLIITVPSVVGIIVPKIQLPNNHLLSAIHYLQPKESEKSSKDPFLFLPSISNLLLIFLKRRKREKAG